MIGVCVADLKDSRANTAICPDPATLRGGGSARPLTFLFAVALLALAAGMFLARDPARLTGPFGDSHDGRNGGEWGLASRALREDGLIASRLGARLDNGTTYVHHPPLIVVETATSESLFGEHPWATRLPAMVSSVAAIVLLFVLLRAWGASTVVSAIAVLVATATPMFFVYGSMLDTPVTSFPFALAVLVLWKRQLDGRTVPPIATGIVATLAVLAGWEATLIVAVVTIAIVVKERRRTSDTRWRQAIRPALPFAVGLGVGVALDLAWVLQAVGGLNDLRSQLFERSTGSTYAAMAENQRIWLRDLFGVLLFALVACMALLRDRRVRPLAAVALGVPLLYSVVLRDGAAHHDYWNFWLVLAVAVGLAFGFERIAEIARERDRRALALFGGTALAVVVVVTYLVAPSKAQELADPGRLAGSLTEAAHFPTPQREVPMIGVIDPPATWITYETGLTSRNLLSFADLRSLATTHPDDLVLVSTWCEDSNDGGLCRTVAPVATNFDDRTYEFVSAAVLEQRAEHPRRSG